MTTLPANPITLTEQLLSSAYTHLGDIVQLPAGHGLIRAPKHVPAILWQPKRDVPILSASRLWARVAVTVVTYAHEDHLLLDPADLRHAEAGEIRVHPGYLDPAYADLTFRVRQRPVPNLSRECGLFRVKHMWQVSLRLKTN